MSSSRQSNILSDQTSRVMIASTRKTPLLYKGFCIYICIMNVNKLQLVLTIEIGNSWPVYVIFTIVTFSRIGFNYKQFLIKVIFIVKSEPLTTHPVLAQICNVIINVKWYIKYYALHLFKILFRRIPIIFYNLITILYFTTLSSQV